jgi:hypothetical protein
MSFKLVGEVVIDGRKGTTALKDLQREANKTSDTFRRAGGNTERLGKSLLSLGLNAGRAGTSLGALSRLGAGGLFGAAVLGSINKFGETVKQASTDYYQSQKALSDAFEMSFKSTSVEQAQAGLEKTEDTIESLRGKITQLGAFGGILKGIEKFTGINLGVGDTEKALKDARDNLKVQEQLVETRQFEKAVAKEAETKGGEEAKRVAASKILAELESVRNGEKVDLIKNAKEELKLAEYLLYLNGYQIEELYKRKSLGVDIKKLDELTRDGQIKDLEVAKARLSLAKAIKAERAIESKQAQEAGGGLLGASRAGQQALDTARKVRAREVNKEDFRTQDQVFEKMKTEENVKRKAQGLPPVTAQSMREKVAAQQAAGEMPLLSEKLGAMQGTTPASQIAAEQAKGGGGADMQKSLLEAIKALSDKLPAAVATG